MDGIFRLLMIDGLRAMGYGNGVRMNYGSWNMDNGTSWDIDHNGV
jgi:hypothetical protein